jgi:hypothetical protein
VVPLKKMLNPSLTAATSAGKSKSAHELSGEYQVYLFA